MTERLDRLADHATAVIVAGFAWMGVEFVAAGAAMVLFQ